MPSLIYRSEPQKGRRRTKFRPMAEINVTPFVDVVLVLLIIFIVAAPLLTVGIPVQLPETKANPLPSEPEQPLTLSVAVDGRVALQSSEIPRDELIARLAAVIAERDSDRIYVRGDRDARYEVIMKVMGDLNDAGFRNIGLVTNSEETRDETAASDLSN
ncbi:MAG: ExbD/TolR family protein [Rhodobacteraceae bacterium]|nr:ExbD/TolR family protein [Paracoccaceae bacterium]